MSRFGQIVAVMVAGFMPVTSYAQDATALSDDDLLGQVEAATIDRDADALLSFMVEVESRGLLMFSRDTAQCDAVVPETGLLENMMSFGNARRSYIVRARQVAMAEGNCGCIFESISFEEFAQELVGNSGNSLTGADLDQMRSFRREFESPVDTEYRAYRRNTCGKS